ncbi:hypothetical protein BDP27DRAFT_1363882 [Rhodocollybia butyracea]|uniref:Uncharacterized protein n=1 Tax=Rhodocollybia butyracea TaxID=206335 RepID=A0A9P5PUM3_9AGAR|nr:hypothetical protein BDP27DRAFT_1363882 [Rhodocollybia butyracea]
MFKFCASPNELARDLWDELGWFYHGDMKLNKMQMGGASKTEFIKEARREALKTVVDGRLRTVEYRPKNGWPDHVTRKLTCKKSTAEHLELIIRSSNLLPVENRYSCTTSGYTDFVLGWFRGIVRVVGELYYIIISTQGTKSETDMGYGPTSRAQSYMDSRINYRVFPTEQRDMKKRQEIGKSAACVQETNTFIENARPFKFMRPCVPAFRSADDGIALSVVSYNLEHVAWFGYTPDESIAIVGAIERSCFDRVNLNYSHPSLQLAASQNDHAQYSSMVLTTSPVTPPLH